MSEPDADGGGLDLLPLDEALKVLAISRRSFYRAVDAGLITKVKHGGRTKVPREAIADYRARLIREAERERLARERAARRKIA